MFLVTINRIRLQSLVVLMVGFVYLSFYNMLLHQVLTSRTPSEVAGVFYVRGKFGD